MNYVIDDETKKLLIKLFIIPFVASSVFGLLSIGPSDFSFKVVTASFCVGFEFVFVIFIFRFFIEAAHGNTLVIFFAVAGISSGIIWWQIACPPWSVIIIGAVGGILAVLWFYFDGSLRRDIE